MIIAMNKLSIIPMTAVDNLHMVWFVGWPGEVGNFGPIIRWRCCG